MKNNCRLRGSRAEHVGATYRDVFQNQFPRPPDCPSQMVRLGESPSGFPQNAWSTRKHSVCTCVTDVSGEVGTGFGGPAGPILTSTGGGTAVGWCRPPTELPQPPALSPGGFWRHSGCEFNRWWAGDWEGSGHEVCRVLFCPGWVCPGMLLAPVGVGGSQMVEVISWGCHPPSAGVLRPPFHSAPTDPLSHLYRRPSLLPLQGVACPQWGSSKLFTPCVAQPEAQLFPS